MKRTRKRAKRRQAKPRTRRLSSRTTKPTTTKKWGLSPDALKTITNALPGTITAVAKLVEALKGH